MQIFLIGDYMVLIRTWSSEEEKQRWRAYEEYWRERRHREAYLKAMKTAKPYYEISGQWIPISENYKLVPGDVVRVRGIAKLRVKPNIVDSVLGNIDKYVASKLVGELARRGFKLLRYDIRILDKKIGDISPFTGIPRYYDVRIAVDVVVEKQRDPIPAIILYTIIAAALSAAIIAMSIAWERVEYYKLEKYKTYVEAVKQGLQVNPPSSGGDNIFEKLGGIALIVLIIIVVLAFARR